MNDALRKKLTEQQEQVKAISDQLLYGIQIDACRAFNERNTERVKQLEMYQQGVKDLRASIINAIEDEKQKAGRT